MLVENIKNSPFKDYFSLSLEVEQELALYMEEKFYPHYFDKWERIKDKKLQNEGLDVIGSSSKLGLQKISIDEKGACQYVDPLEKLTTFACELLYFKDYQKRAGWLVDEHKRNDYYLFMWPRANQYELHHIDEKKYEFFRKKDITSVAYALVKKESLIEYLKGIGWDYIALFDKVKNILCDQHFDRERIGEVEFIRSNKYPESPINILIKKEVLDNLAILKGNC